MQVATKNHSKKVPVFPVEEVRAHFPILATEERGKPLTFLDSAASAQKPQAVLDAVDAFYKEDYANIHRGVYGLSQRATAAYEAARAKVAEFLGAKEPAEVIFTRGATEAINLVASTLAVERLKAGDNVVLTAMEHHANIVPWQLLEARMGLEVRVLPVDERGVLEMDKLPGLIDERTRVVGVVHISNALGTINPVREIANLAHAAGALVLVDGAQAVPHFAPDLEALGADFYVFSGHKLFGPTGIGVLWGKGDVLRQLPPYQGGGDMIKEVSFSGTTFRDIPERFEAGTPAIAQAVGLGAAIDYLNTLDAEAMHAWEMHLLEYGTARLSEVEGLKLIGTAPDKIGVLSFLLDWAHTHDVGTFLDQDNVAVRTGHHCAQPLMQHFGIRGTTRASLAFYNTEADVDRLVASLQKMRRFFV